MPSMPALVVILATLLALAPASGGGRAEAQEIGLRAIGTRSNPLADPRGGALDVTFREGGRAGVRVGYGVLHGNRQTSDCPQEMFCLSLVASPTREAAWVHQAAVSVPVGLVRRGRVVLRLVPGLHVDLLSVNLQVDGHSPGWRTRQAMWGAAVGVEAGVRLLADHPVDLLVGLTRADLRSIGDGATDSRHFGSIPLRRLELGVIWRPWRGEGPAGN